MRTRREKGGKCKRKKKKGKKRKWKVIKGSSKCKIRVERRVTKRGKIHHFPKGGGISFSDQNKDPCVKETTLIKVGLN
jgi:hypothetical protein